MAEHVLKTAAPYFDAVVSGEKPFDVRRNDRCYQRGDTVVLLDMGRCSCTSLACTKRPAPPRFEITYVYSGDPRFGHGLERNGGIVPGFVVLGLRRLEAGSGG